MTQLFTEHLFGAWEICLLVTMACDHYVAICWHLHYVTLLNHHINCFPVRMCWVVSCFHSKGQILVTFCLPFCGSNIMMTSYVTFFPWYNCLHWLFPCCSLGCCQWGNDTCDHFHNVISYVVSLCFLRTHHSAGRKNTWLPVVLTSQLAWSLCLYFNVSVTSSNLSHE